MKTLLTKITLFAVILSLASCNASADTKVSKETIAKEKESVVAVLRQYKDAVENLTTENTAQLFAEDSQVYESGGSEGSYKDYEGHHLAPELKYFKSFKFNNYKVDVRIDMPFAFTTETYIYEIVIKANPEKGREERVITKKGVATSVLKKSDGQWKILRTHSSSRDYKPKS